MAYTGTQNLYLCCGYYCSLLACIGVYFWLVLFFMESTNSPYLIYYMQRIPSMDDTDQIDTMRWSFFLTAIVSFDTPNLRCTDECILLLWMLFLRNDDQARARHYRRRGRTEPPGSCRASRSCASGGPRAIKLRVRPKQPKLRNLPTVRDQLSGVESA